MEKCISPRHSQSHDSSSAYYCYLEIRAKRNEGPSTPSLAVPRTGDNYFLPLREELQGMKKCLGGNWACLSEKRRLISG